MKNTIIIGPSKVGKTALVATLKHAADMLTFNKKNQTLESINVISKNDRTRQLFTKALDVLRHGDMPFAGTALTVRYDFVVEMEQKNTGSWAWFSSLFAKEKLSSRFQFMDAPGGAIFSEEVQKVGKKDPNFKNLVEQMCSAHGLIVCVDSTDALITDKKKRQSIKNFYKRSMEYLLAHGYLAQLPFENICFILTKADLYAKKMGRADDAELFLQECDSAKLVREIVGEATLTTLKTFIGEGAKICFSMTSVFGCRAAKEDSGLGVKRDEEVQLTLEQWDPYNVVESFAFLISGTAHHPIQKIVTYENF